MLKRMRIFLAVIVMMVAASVNAQVTTSTLSGKVVDANGEAVIGATVQATHMPSGTHYGTITNMDGLYTIQGMRTGGPYKVEISYIGYQTVNYPDVTLQLGEIYNLNTTLKESSAVLDEVVVIATRSKFSNEKTGASTNISNAQIAAVPTVNRSISDIARLSPYANGMGFAGGDGRSTNFTLDGANMNNNFGLSDALPGGGNPVSMDAIEEIQVVVSPFDVRQTNFIGGGINAITKSGTNTFKGTAYTYQYNEHWRGNKIDGTDLGERDKDRKHVYGFTLGGPVIKDKLFFFVNAEYQKIPNTIVDWKASTDGNPDPVNYISRASVSDLQTVSDFVKQKYGYDTGSFTDFPADESNFKILGRIDWNINDNHRLAVRYNKTSNAQWNPTNPTSSDINRLSQGRISAYGMAYAMSMYKQERNFSSLSADLNSRFGDKISNQLLLTYSHTADPRSYDSADFPFVEIMKDNNPYITLGTEVYSFNNNVENNVFNVIDNFTAFLGSHKLTAGLSFEHQIAKNYYMRGGTGYYRYGSMADFMNGAAPIGYELAYGYEGNLRPSAQVSFNQFGLYVQDEWTVSDRLKLTGGIRFDEIVFNNNDLLTNKALLDVNFGGRHIDTGKWSDSNIQVSPRVGFSWDVFGDKTLKVRGGTGLFAGRLPLVYFVNMPGQSGMFQANPVYKAGSAELEKLAGGLIPDVAGQVSRLGLPNQPGNGVILKQYYAGVDKSFKMPQVWKTSLGVDYQLPVSFPLTITGEFTYTDNINTIYLDNYNINNSTLGNFDGLDKRVKYPSASVYQYNTAMQAATVLRNTSKGYGWTGNITITAEPVKDLKLMAAYTHTVMKELTGMPGSNANAAWSGIPTVSGPNFLGLHSSQYVKPDRVIASASYTLKKNSHFSLVYSGFSAGVWSWQYTNDMNGDGVSYDLMYIPLDVNELNFKNEADRAEFWKFLEQDSYMKNHKGEYAAAYETYAPWVHRFDFRFAQDFSVKVGNTKHALELSVDIMNIGNLFNSKWGVMKNMSTCNSGKILKYEGVNTLNQPVYSLWRDSKGNAPTKTWEYNHNDSQCWQLQIGVKYIFN